MSKEWSERVNQYIAEARTVSGGDANGPGKPGYQILTLTGNATNDTAAINALADQGYVFVAFFQPYGFVLMGNYKKD